MNLRLVTEVTGMSEYITGFNTMSGVKKYDYNALANIPDLPVIAKFYSTDGEINFYCENYTHDELVAMLRAGKVVIARMLAENYRYTTYFCTLYTAGNGQGSSDEVWIERSISSVSGWVHDPSSSDYFDENDREIWVER
jgi:hypothetical protein